MSTNAVVEPEFESTLSHLFSLTLMFDCSKIESLRDVNITRIVNSLSYGFLQTDIRDGIK